MIYLKRLELHNFKSFIGTTKIPFSKNFTVITGPNGSGKSNIIDAIKWVLGEQRVKTLRAEKLDEVIFGGNKFHPPSNFAEVDLCLQLDDDEIEISRKLYRGEESNYYINNKLVRLKDIQMFFLNLGLGRYSFAILGQGEIDDLIVKEDGRVREIIESIAGISGYHEKVKDILLKLEVIENEWGRLEEKRKEMEANLNILKEEARVAQRYEEINKKIAEVQESLKYYLWQKALKNLEKYKKEFENIDLRLKELENVIGSTLLNKEELQREKEHIDKILKDKKGYLENLDNEIQKLSIEKSRNEEKRNLLIERLKSISEEKVDLEKELYIVGTQKNDVEKKLESINSENYGEIFDVLKDKETALQEKIIEKSRLEQRIREFSEFSFSHENIEILDSRINKINMVIRNWEKRLVRLKNFKESLEKDYIEKNKIFRKKEEIFEKNIVEINKLKNLIGELKESLIENYPRGVREIIQYKKEKIHDIFKNIIEIPFEYLEALYNLLGNTIYDIIVDNEKTAKELISFLKEKRAGWATFRPLTLNKYDKVKDLPEKLKNVAVRAIDIVKYDSQYDSLVKNILGNVIIFNNYDSAVENKDVLNDGWRIVTLQGEVFLPSGTISGGIRFNIEATLLSEKSIAENEEKVKDLIESNEFLKKDLEILRNEIDKMKEIRIKLEPIIIRLENLIRKKSEEREKLLERRKKLEVYEREGRFLEDRLRAIIDEINSLQEDIKICRDKYENYRIQKIALEKELNLLQERYSYLEKRVKNMDQEKMKIDNDLSNLGTNINYLENRIKELLQEKRKVLEENNEFFERQNLLMAHIKELEKRWQEYREEEIILLERKKDLLNRIRELEVDIENNYHGNLELKIGLPEEKLKILEKDLVKELEELGPVNFLAKTKLEEEEKKYKELIMQIDDVYGSVSSLKKIIRETKEEAERKFISCFLQFKDLVNKNWQLFFPNSSLEIFLDNENDPLSSDIKLRISSQKKNWRNIIMLSGGEKSLVGISILLSAVELAHVNFCFWDEIDSALDNQNAMVLGRKIKELSKENQFILISHNPVLMQYADIIYGVTLNDKGSSQVLSWKLEEEVAN
jgi:chromosome segregation protein